MRASLATTALSLVVALVLGGGDCQPEPPAECGADECGAAPVTVCDDGSGVTATVCGRDGQGDCAWTPGVCLPACTDDECGPAPRLPTTLCSDGTWAGPGPCARQADGACGWEIRSCPVYTFCGGFAARPCAQGFICVDDQADSCDPDNGGADCGGICVDEATCGPPTCPDRS